MAEALTIARPYAKAAFVTAQAKQQLAAWSRMLAAAAAGVGEPAVQTLLGSPKLPKQQIAQIFIELVGQELGDSGANFIVNHTSSAKLIIWPMRVALMFTGEAPSLECGRGGPAGRRG